MHLDLVDNRALSELAPCGVHVLVCKQPYSYRTFLSVNQSSWIFLLSLAVLQTLTGHLHYDCQSTSDVHSQITNEQLTVELPAVGDRGIVCVHLIAGKIDPASN